MLCVKCRVHSNVALLQWSWQHIIYFPIYFVHSIRSGDENGAVCVRWSFVKMGFVLIVIMKVALQPSIRSPPPPPPSLLPPSNCIYLHCSVDFNIQIHHAHLFRKWLFVFSGLSAAMLTQFLINLLVLEATPQNVRIEF